MGGGPCPTINCKVCETSEEDDVKCRGKNIVYTNICQKCKEEGRDAGYIGETGRSVGERTGEHWDDWKKRAKGTHINDHMEDCHKGEEPDMKLEIVKRCKTALQRQVSETINIKFQKMKGSLILNNKLEYK